MGWKAKYHWCSAEVLGGEDMKRSSPLAHDKAVVKGSLPPSEILSCEQMKRGSCLAWTHSHWIWAKEQSETAFGFVGSEYLSALSIRIHLSGLKTNNKVRKYFPHVFLRWLLGYQYAKQEYIYYWLLVKKFHFHTDHQHILTADTDTESYLRESMTSSPSDSHSSG